MPCCVRGYHGYKDIWEAVIGEELACDRELDNPSSCNKTWNYHWALTKEDVENLFSVPENKLLK